MEQNVYLKSTEFLEIPSILQSLLQMSKFKLHYETISTKNSINRITYESIQAKASSPCFNAAAMDGIAVSAKSTYQATETNPIILSSTQYSLINTGNQIPQQFDAVIMIEDVVKNNDDSITLLNSAREFQHIRPIGEDIVELDMILPKLHKIRPIDISALLSGGVFELKVLKKITVAIIPTGDEIISDVHELVPGKIIDSNSYYMKNELELMNVSVTVFPVQKDIYETMEETILQATKSFDLILIGAGSSAGTKDYAKTIIEKNGTVMVHGITIKPGKPTIIGLVNEVPIIGIPGYPVSTYMSFENVVKPLINLMNIQHNTTSSTIKAKLTKKVYSSLKNHEFIRVKLGKINNEYIATPLDRGAGVSMSLVKADGLLIIDKHNEGYDTNSIVTIQLLKEISDIEKSLISIGSHDILMDKIDDLLSDFNVHLSSSHVGSFGGVMAMKNKGCHIAPVHILSPDGTYNKFLLDEYLDDQYVLIEGVRRIQGLYVKPNNPKNIRSIKDLTRNDIVFVNRQQGSGTRILLDHLLNNNSINSNDITGYTNELTTHMLVATSVKDSRYDVGMGVQSAANITNIDFIEISEEHYDFIVLKESLNTKMVQDFIRVLKSPEFKEIVEKIGGYRIVNTGNII